MTDTNSDRDDGRSDGPEDESTGTTGRGGSDTSGVGPADAAKNINPGGSGTAAPDPTAPDEGA